MSTPTTLPRPPQISDSDFELRARAFLGRSGRQEYTDKRDHRARRGHRVRVDAAASTANDASDANDASTANAANDANDANDASAANDARASANIGAAATALPTAAALIRLLAQTRDNLRRAQTTIPALSTSVTTTAIEVEKIYDVVWDCYELLDQMTDEVDEWVD